MTFIMSRGFEIPDTHFSERDLKRRNCRKPSRCVDRIPNRAIIIPLSIIRERIEWAN